MWIVRLALRRPYTFVVLAMLIVLMGAVQILRMPTDIYPEINIPVVAAVWSYNGLQPREMEGRMTTPFERATTTTVSGIDHIESQTLYGVSVVKIFLQPGTSIDGAVAEITAAGGRAYPIVADLTHDEDSRRIVKEAARKFGGLDFIWNHVGHPGPGALDAALAVRRSVAVLPTFGG